MVHWWQGIIYLLHDLCALTCMTVVLATTRGFRERNRIVTVGCFVLSGALALLNSLTLDRVIAATDFDTGFLVFGCVSLLSILVLPQVILRSAKHFSSGLICLALNVGTEGLFSIIGYLLNGVDGYAYHFYETVFCMACYSLVTGFLLYASKNKDLKIIRSTVELMPKWLYAVIILCSFSSFFSIMGREPELYDFERYMGVIRALSVFGVILFAGYFVIRVFALMAQQNQILLQLNAQQQNYERMLHNDEQLRKFRHDSKNHMLVVTSLLNAGQTEEAAKYLEKLNDMSGMSERRFLTGNLAVDAILNHKYAVAKDCGVELLFSGTIPECGVESADLCTVIGNMVDNAITGAGAFPGKRYVQLRSAVRGGYLTLTARNPVAKKVAIRNNRVRTTKADAKNHGIGLSNVSAVAKQYHGHMLLACSDTEFTVDVTLMMNDR